MKSLSSIAYKILTALMIVMLALTAMPVSSAFAAVSTPTWFSAANGTTGPVTITPAQLTCAAGANRLLVVVVTAEYNNVEVMALTVLKGVALTQAVKTIGNTRTGIWIGYLNDAQITANAGSNIVVTETPGGDVWQSVNVHATCLTGVDQTTPIVPGGTAQNSSDGNTGTYAFSNVPAVNTGLMIYAAGHNGATSVTQPAGYTESVDAAGASLRVTVGYKAVTATGNESGTITFVGGNDRYAAAVISVNPFLNPPTTTSLISSLNPSNVGDSVIFTATVAPAAATGTVNFFDGATPIGSGLLAGGVATFNTSALTAGSHSITAVYVGDASFSGSTSPILAQNVNGPPTILSANNTTFTVLTAGSFSVIASGFPTPNITTSDPLPAGVTLTTAGLLSGTPATGTAGTYILNITASNGINPDATQVFTLTVLKRNQTINFNAPGSAQYGTTFNVTPTATSGLPVTINSSGGCTNVGFAVTMTSATVNCVLTASQAGNIDYNAAADVPDTVTAQRASTTVSVSPFPHDQGSPSQSFYSQPMTFTVTVSSAVGTPTGTVTLSGGTPNQNITVPLVGGVAQITTSNLVVLIGANVVIAHGASPLVCLLAGISCPALAVTYNGDANFNTDSETVVHTVYPAPTQVNITSIPNPSAAGQSVVFTVTVSTIPPGTGTPPGTIVLYDGATPISGTIALTGGVATFTTSTLTFGAHNISAQYTSTSDNYATSNNTATPYVHNVRRATSTTLTSNNNPSIYGENVTFTSTTTSTTPGAIIGTVTFMDGAAIIGTDTSIVGGVATFTTNSLVVGSHPITAVYGGNGTYATSTSPILDQVVDKATVTVTADNQSITYGDADPSPFTFTYGPFVLLETSAVIDTPPTCDVLVAHVDFGTYPIVCSGGLDDNYTFNYINGSLAVTRKALTITADNRGKDYVDAVIFAGTEFSTSGLIFGDTVTSVTLFSPGAPAFSPVIGSPYPIIPSAAVGTGLSNYLITYVNGSLTIGTNILTITANDQVKTYGDVFTFAGVQYSVAGLQIGDSVTSVTLTSAGAPSPAVVGTYPIVPSAAVGTGLTNYTIIYVNGQMDVNQRALSFDPSDQTKIYGSVFSAYSGAFTGLRAGDNITPIYDSAGAVATAPVGTYSITVTLDDPDGKLGNYIVTIDPVPAAVLTVTTKAVNVTADNQTKDYGTLFTFAGTEFTTSGFTNGDSVTSVTLTSTGAPAAALASPPLYPIVPSAAVPALGTDLSNYNINYVNGNMNVTKPDLIVTSDGQSKVYGDLFTAFTGSIVGIQNGDNITATYDSLGGPAAALFGTYPINITLNDPDGKLVNYNVIQNVGLLSVIKRDLTVIADNQTKLYGDTVLLTGTVTGVQPGDGITFTYSSPGTALTAPVGTYSIAITMNDPLNRIGNYNFTLTPATLTVTLRNLVVTPDDQSKNYGAWFLAFTGTINGIQNGENITANYASTGSQPSAAVGTYPITATLNDPTGKLGNYNVTLNTGTLTVSSSVLTVTAEDKTITYGAADPAFTLTYFGFAAGDTPAVINTPPTCTVAGAHTDVGTYSIVCSGGVDNAYTFIYVPGTLTVTPRTLDVTPGSATKIYGSVFSAFTGTVTPIQFGDNITATYASAGAPGLAIVGTYPITATLNDPDGKLVNYTVNLNTGTLTVTPRDLLVQPGDKIKAFGTVFTAFTGSIVGIQNSDNITATYNSTGAPAIAPVGTYPITATLNDPNGRLPNYTVSIGTATLSVVIADQTITVTTSAPGNAANGDSFTVAATASSDLPVVYSATGVCSNVGAVFTITSPTGICVVHYNQPGDADFGPAPEVTENVTALPNSQTITVTTSAPAVASPNSVFDVAATASSGLTVSISASGVCTIVNHGDGTATITIVAPNGSCIVLYNQAGNATFASAPQITENITIDSTAPTVTVNQDASQADPTNVSPINFTVVFNEAVTGFTDLGVTVGGTAGAATAIVTGVGSTYNVAVSGMLNDGTVTVSIPAGAATDIAGNANFASSSTDNAVTYFDGVGPNVEVINTNPATSDQVLTNGERVTFNITHLKVKFNQDVYNPPGDSDPDDVTNPNNYMLIRDLGDTVGLQTVSCVTGAVIPADTNIAIGTVTYDSETYIATFTINSGLPLSNGDYHLFVCGTTSIVDPLNNALALVGSSGLPDTDFRGSFTVNITNNGGGGGGGGAGGTTSTLATSGALIPVTGFDPNQVTLLPVQPADKAYQTLDDIRIEIPSLGINYPIVGVSLSRNNWNLTWLQDGVGYLEGSAYPTFNGNTVLTAHVNDASKNLGPFSDIKGLQLGDRILIHAYGNIYVYEVQVNTKISPNDISTAFRHEEYAWITLVTCEDYNAKIEEYYHRRMVRAVLISVVLQP